MGTFVGNDSGVCVSLGRGALVAAGLVVGSTGVSIDVPHAASKTSRVIATVNRYKALVPYLPDQGCDTAPEIDQQDCSLLLLKNEPFRNF